MIILDTGHIVTLKYSTDERFARLAKRMADSRFARLGFCDDSHYVGRTDERVACTNSATQGTATAGSRLTRLTGLVDFFSCWTILPFDDDAAKNFVNFRKQKIRTATMDLKIASIAVSQSCLLLTANTRDFESIPGIRIEDWLN